MTLLEARTYLRLLLNERSAAFWKDADLTSFINQSFFELYGEIFQSNEAHFATTTNITYVSGTSLYNLPTGGINRIILVERVDQDVKMDLRPCAAADKNRFEQSASSSLIPGQERWYLLGNQIGFTPTPRSAITNVVTIHYVPESTALAADGDEFPAALTNLHHECIVWGAFLRAITKDRELVAAHMPHFTRLWALLKADTNRRQYQEAIGFVIPSDYDF